MSTETINNCIQDARQTLVESRRRTGCSTPGWGTRFVVLIKPEILRGPSAAESTSVLASNLREQGITIQACAAWPGDEFVRAGLLRFHYPRLHRVAAVGQNALTTSSTQKLKAVSGHLPVRGAFEVLSAPAELRPTTPDELQEACRSSGIIKLGSGSYASLVELDGSSHVVLNGFVPALIKHFEDPESLVVALDCWSEQEIDTLRDETLGNLDPETAAPGSLRRLASELSIAQHDQRLSPERNGVHLSAGHLEAAVQVGRYFGTTPTRHSDIRQMLDGLTSSELQQATVHTITLDEDVALRDGTRISPFGATEGLSRAHATELVRQWNLASTGRRST